MTDPGSKERGVSRVLGACSKDFGEILSNLSDFSKYLVKIWGGGAPAAPLDLSLQIGLV